MIDQPHPPSRPRRRILAGGPNHLEWVDVDPWASTDETVMIKTRLPPVTAFLDADQVPDLRIETHIYRRQTMRFAGLPDVHLMVWDQLDHEAYPPEVFEALAAWSRARRRGEPVV